MTKNVNVVENSNKNILKSNGEKTSAKIVEVSSLVSVCQTYNVKNDKSIGKGK